MPQLKSGRHIGLSASPYLDALAAESDESKYLAIAALRLIAGTPEALREHLVIGYFGEGQGTPPDAPSYNSGYRVADVLEGRSDWSADEIEEFRQFLDEPRIRIWLQNQFDEINDAIRDNPVWDSEFLADDIESTEPDSEALSSFDSESFVPEDQSNSRPKLPDELRELILSMAKREDVHSVSCQFWDARLWEGLLGEQVKRAQQTGKSPRKAFFLCGPDSGIPGIAKHHHGLEDLPPEEWFHGDTLEEKLGGDIHVPYEGVCGADLYVYPSWRTINPKAWEKEGAQLDWATAGKRCNHLLIEQDLGEPSCATRTGPIAGSWWLYSSNAPYKPCSPFHQDD